MTARHILYPALDILGKVHAHCPSVHIDLTSVAAGPISSLSTFTMSTPSAISRSAPIAIAPKPSRFASSRQGSAHPDAYPGSFNHSGFDTPDSVGSPSTGFPAWPCEPCQQRRIRCVMSDDDDACISCRSGGIECSLVSSPPPRKRKLHGEYSESMSKRGYVSPSLVSFEHVPATHHHSPPLSIHGPCLHRKPYRCLGTAIARIAFLLPDAPMTVFLCLTSDWSI